MKNGIKEESLLRIKFYNSKTFMSLLNRMLFFILNRFKISKNISPKDLKQIFELNI